MANAGGIRAGAAYVELYAQDNKLVRGLQAAERKLKAFGAGIQSIGAKVAALGAAAKAPFLGAAKVYADLASELMDMSQRTGVSVEALSELGFAAEQSGADMETLEAGLRKMQKFVVEAASGSKEARGTLERLGLTFQQLGVLSPDEQLKLIADRLAAIRNPAVRTATALDIFGKNGAKLLPMMADGAQGIAELQQQARDLGLVMSTEDAKAGEAFGDALGLLGKSVKFAAAALGAALLPALKETVEFIPKAIKWVSDWIKRNGDLIRTLFHVAEIVVAVGLALLVVGTAFSVAGSALGAMAGVIAGIGTAFGVLGSILAALLSPIGLVVTGVVGLAAYFLYASGIGEQALGWLGEAFQGLLADATASFKGISDALAAGDLGLAAKILWLTLKLEWQKGINVLQEAWSGFRNFFVAVWTEAVFNVAAIFTNAWAGLQSAWAETVAGLLTAWTVFTDGATAAWKGAQNFIARGIVRLMGLLDDSVNVEATLRTLDEDANREKQARGRATQEQLAGIERDRQRRQGEIEQQRTGALGVLEGDRKAKQDERQKQQGGDLAASQAALDAARAEMLGAIGEAAKKREQTKLPPRVEKARQAIGSLDELGDLAKEKFSTKGTFNAVGVAGLGGGNVAERTAKATEQTAAHAKRLVQKADGGGLAFG